MGIGKSEALKTQVTARDYIEAFDECHDNNGKFEFFYSAAADCAALKQHFEHQVLRASES
jgi:hypothetical protein